MVEGGAVGGAPVLPSLARISGEGGSALVRRAVVSTLRVCEETFGGDGGGVGFAALAAVPGEGLSGVQQTGVEQRRSLPMRQVALVLQPDVVAYGGSSRLR